MTDEERALEPANLGGRPSGLTEGVLLALVQVVSQGNYLTVACRTLGIPYSTYQGWRQRGEREKQEGLLAGDSLYVRLVDSVGRAEAEAEERAVSAWTSAMGEDWRAAMEYLARKAPQRWGRPETRDLLRGAAAEIKELHLHLEGPQDAYLFLDPEDNSTPLLGGAKEDDDLGIVEGEWREEE